MDAIIYNGIPRGWNGFLEQAGQPSVIHQKEYLDFLSRTGYQVRTICCIDNNRIVSALPFLIHKKFGLKILFYSPLAGYDSLIHLPAVDNLKPLLEKFVKLSKSKTVIFAKLSDLSSHLEGYRNYLISKGFYHEKEPIYVIKLKPIEKIWNEDIDKKLRNSIRKARKSLKVEEIVEPEQVKQLYPLFIETGRRHREKAHPLSRYIELLNLPRGMIKWFAARHNGKYIATSIYWLNTNTIFYAENAYLKEYGKYAGSDLMMWEMIKFAFEGGFKSINLMGIPENNPGLKHFKEKWGSKLVDCDVYVYKSTLGKLSYRMKDFVGRFLKVV